MKSMLAECSGTQTLLLHVCCAVCAAGALARLSGTPLSITLYFYNPNINTKEEYLKRANELIKLKTKFKIQEIVIKECTPVGDSTLGVLHNCQTCISHRLQKAAQTAANNNYNYYATTLTASPHKDANFINVTSAELSKQYNIKHLPTDFKKENGFLIANKIAAELNLYRQSYCGCENSKKA